ncbi:MAG: hypothetical protein NT136_02675 [Candidatus Moranbacteria bacterium]|nr:hypothetical protein [Candidatus Moranbacteria bacterium]
MRKSVLTLALCFAVIFCATQVTATMVTGNDAGAVSNDYSFSAVTKEGFSVTLPRVVGVFDRDPKIKGTKPVKNELGQDRWVLRYKDNPKAFEGAELYAFGTQSNWPGGKTLKGLKHGTKKELGKAQITGDSVTLMIKNKFPNVEYFYQPIIWVVVLKDNHQAWGGHIGWPDGPYIVLNKQGQVQTWFLVNNKEGKILPPGDEGRKLASERN